MHQPVSATDSDRPVTIAVLEDDSPTAFLYRMLFDAHGFNAGIFAEADECCAYIHERHPDLLIFDVIGLTQNGLNVLATLNQEYGQALPPVIIATALRNYQISDHPFLAQVSEDNHAILYKPFDVEDLLKHIDTFVLSRRKAAVKM